MCSERIGSGSKLLTALFLVFFSVNALSQSAHKLMREGDRQYSKGEYVEAEEAYRKAGTREDKKALDYNLGNAIYEQGRYEESVREYQETISESQDPELRANAYHNMGNALFRAEKYKESIEAFVESLKIDPKDLETKKNLTMALQQVKQQQQQQQQQQKESEEEKEDEQQQQQQQQQDQPPEQQAPEDLSQREAEELLRIIENEDQKVQEKLRKSTGERGKPEKDW